jgi:hypothetical protein
VTPYQKRGFKTFYMRVPVQSGGEGVVRSCGTRDADTAREIEVLVERLASRKRWDLLGAVTSKPAKITLSELYYADRTNRLDELLEMIEDEPLVVYLDDWESWVRSNLGNTGTAEMYRMQISTLIADPTQNIDVEGRISFVSELTAPAVSKWLASRKKKNGEPVSTGYKRKLLYALFSMINYLREMQVLTTNPVEDVKRPKKGKPRIRYESEANDIRIVEAIDGAARQSLAAFIKSTGAEVSAALAMYPRDIELWPEDDEFYCGVGHVPGTKTDTRDRHDVLIEKWARPWLEREMKNAIPRKRIWDGISRFQARDAHVAACRAVEVDDYTLRDSRHSWAVRGRRFRAASFEAIAEQLGNTPWQAANTYAQFKPSMAERRAEGQKTELAANNSANNAARGGPASVVPLKRRGA